MRGAIVRGAQLLIEKGLFNPSGRPQHHYLLVSRSTHAPSFVRTFVRTFVPYFIRTFEYIFTLLLASYEGIDHTPYIVDSWISLTR